MTTQAAPSPIRVLPRAVVERIAAGEVIQRPACVVRELVDNALDAGATRVEVELRRGGLELIRVADDGHGIPAEQLTLAVAPHTTSKLRALDDLAGLTTLGFRGEALASIATAAELHVVSQIQDAAVGAGLRVVGSTPQEQTLEARRPGTTVAVSELFARQPVRLRFLQGTRAETAAVAQLLRHYALARPAVAFSLTVDGQLAFRAPGGEQGDALAAVHGPDLAARMPLVAERELAPGRLAVWLGGAEVTRAGRAGLVWVVNGRAVRCPGLQTAAEAAYRPLLPRGRHPLMLVRLDLRPGMVDVNVHPAKAEVRLYHERALAEALAEVLTQSLGQQPIRPALADDALAWRAPAPRLAETPMPYGADSDEAWIATPHLPRLRLLAVAGQGLMLAETANGLLLIDLHRAHERVIHEGMRESPHPPAPSLERGGGVIGTAARDWSTAESLAEALAQDSPPRSGEGPGVGSVSPSPIEPLVLELTPAQARRLADYLPDLARLGFACEPFGQRQLLVRHLPAGVPWDAARDSLVEALGERPGADDWRDRLLIRLACRSAVRRGELLPRERAAALIRELGAVPSPAACPHGSPILLELGDDLLARQFRW